MPRTNRQQQEVQNAAEFRRALTILHQAAVGVVLVRTREPYRAIETIRDFAFAESIDFRVWSVLHGWMRYDRSQPDAEPQSDNMVEPMAALRAIQGVGNQDGFPNGVYVMMYPHFYLPKIPAMMQCVKEYTRIFAENKKRLILVTPLVFELPPELEDDVAILDFDAPSYRELGAIYDRLLEAVPSEKRPRFNGEDRDRVLAAGSGMTAHEFENALSRALVAHRSKLPRVSVDEITEGVMKVKTEVVKRSEVLEVMDTDNMENVGGLTARKTWLTKRARCFSQEAKDFGIDPPKGIMLAGPPGTGCQPAGSKVLMADGTFGRVENVARADWVMSPQRDGTVIPVQVSSVRRCAAQTIYRIRTTGRGGERSYLCSESHILPIVALERPGPHSLRRRESAVREYTVQEFLRRGASYRAKARIFTTPAYDLPAASFRVHPYVLGVLLGNGSLTQADRIGFDLSGNGAGNGSVTVTIRDEEVIERATGFGMQISSKAWRGGAWVCQVSGSTREWLCNSALAGCSSHNKFVPEPYKRSSIEQRLWLLAGLIDTDGSAGGEFATTSEFLAEDFVDLVHSIGGTACSRSRTTRTGGKSFHSYRIHFSHGEHAIPVQCERKRLPERNMEWKNPRNTAFEIEEVGVDIVYGFVLECGSQWYVTDNWLVTCCSGSTQC